MQRFTALGVGVVAAALTWFAAGCGGGSAYPVEGRVVFKDGTPLRGGMVMFELMGDEVARVSSRGEIQPDGTFRMWTYSRYDGAPPGRHRAWVTEPLPDGGPEKLAIHVIDPRFTRPETSPLEFTVERRRNAITVEVDRP
jgi:hypothetical protein